MWRSSSPRLRDPPGTASSNCSRPAPGLTALRIIRSGWAEMKLTRRSAMGMLAGASLALSQTPRLPFGFSLYGMKTLPWREGLAQVARIGYQCTELCLRAGWDTEPKLLTKADRAEVRKRTGDLGLELSSVMENLVLG